MADYEMAARSTLQQAGRSAHTSMPLPATTLLILFLSVLALIFSASPAHGAPSAAQLLNRRQRFTQLANLLQSPYGSMQIATSSISDGRLLDKRESGVGDIIQPVSDYTGVLENNGGGGGGGRRLSLSKLRRNCYFSPVQCLLPLNDNAIRAFDTMNTQSYERARINLF